MSAAPKTDRDVLAVSALIAQLRGLVEGRFPSVWVAGEVSNFTKAASGHMYLTIKDAKAQLKAVLFRGVNLRMKFEPKNGMEVIARGRVTVYEPRGDVQMQVEELHPKGVGAAELALRQLKEKLLGSRLLRPAAEAASGELAGARPAAVPEAGSGWSCQPRPGRLPSVT